MKKREEKENVEKYLSDHKSKKAQQKRDIQKTITEIEKDRAAFKDRTAYNIAVMKATD